MKTRNPNNLPRLTQWYEEAGRQAGLSHQAIQVMQRDGRIKLRLRTEGRQVYVLPPYPKIEPRLPREGEVTIKEWISNKALELGQSFRCVQAAVYRGKYQLQKRHVNSKVVFVQTSK